jgi:parallel beta-helix repeat protein
VGIFNHHLNIRITDGKTGLANNNKPLHLSVVYGEKMMKRVVCISVLVLFACTVFLGLSSAGSPGNKTNDTDKTQLHGYAVHSPIRINNDTDPQWASYPGRVITGYEINGTGFGFCIYIGNCTIPFTVKDCFLHHASNKDVIYCYNSGLLVYNSSNGNISNNKCTNSGKGIHVRYSSNSSISQNNASYNTALAGTDMGIYLYYSQNNIVSDNSICMNNYGIMSSYSDNNTFNHNRLLDTGYGFRLRYSNVSTICDNNIVFNDMNGFLIDNSRYNVIKHNIIKNNTRYGIYIRGSYYNGLYLNYFLNNNNGKKQANDTTGGNFWNTSYPTGGNYWSDWTSPDVKSGPNQNQSGSDSIVDSPYTIDGNIGAIDFYPLTKYVIVPESPPPIPLTIFSILMISTILIHRRRW